MGYDFMLLKAKDISKVRFPCEIGDFEIEEGTLPWDLLKEHILALGAREQDFSPLGLDLVTYRWEIEDKGAIDVHGTADCVYLDMHADWDVVLDLFLWLRARDFKIVLFDESIGNYHDPDSFRRFMDENRNA
jgi:hypothetical protein